MPITPVTSASSLPWSGHGGQQPRTTPVAQRSTRHAATNQPGLAFRAHPALGPGCLVNIVC